MRRVDGFGSEAFSTTSASAKPQKRSDRLLCNRQAGQFSGSTWLSWQSWWPKGKPQLTAAKSTVSTSRASEDAEPIEMSVLRVSMVFDFSGLAKKRNFNPSRLALFKHCPLNGLAAFGEHQSGRPKRDLLLGQVRTQASKAAGPDSAACGFCLSAIQLTLT